MPKNRIYILGTSGSGKTFLAKKLSNAMNIKHYDLDDVFWVRKYDKKRDEKDRIKLLDKICRSKQWIIEGVYTSWVEKASKRSDLVIWLDTPSYAIIWRIIYRFLQRKRKHQESWKDIIALIKYARNYRKKDQPAGYYRHKELIEKHKVDLVYIKNKTELNKFLKDFIQKPTT